MPTHPDNFAGAPHLRLELLSQPRLLASVRALVGSVAQRLGFNETQCGQISLAVDEALCNVINHGYERREDGRIWINIWSSDRAPAGLRIVIEDLARQVDPNCIKSRDLADVRPGGLGVFIIHEIMDEVHYERRPEGGMRLTMEKRLPGNETQEGTIGRIGAPEQTGAGRQGVVGG